MKKVYGEAGTRILEMRKIKGISREKLAKESNLTPRFIYEIETGRKGFSAITLLRICNALGTNCHYIMTGESQILYDERVEVLLKMFDKKQSEQIVSILKKIHELLEE